MRRLPFVSERSRAARAIAHELQRTIHQRRKEFADGKPRALYHAVDRLAHGGLIEPVETSREGRRPERTVYRITPQGRDQLAVRLIDLLETPPAESAPFAIALSFLAYVSPSTAVEALQKRVLLLEGQIAALDAGMQMLAGQFRMPRLALVEEEWNRAQRQAERDFAGQLIDAIHSGSVTWDVNWDEVNPFNPADSGSLPTTTGDAEHRDHHDPDNIPSAPQGPHP